MTNVRKFLPILACLAAALAVGTAQAQLIAFYEFEGNANDSSGNGLHATNNGMTYTTGANGQAVGNDGTSGNYVDVPLNVGPETANKLTWGGWVKVDWVSKIQSIAWYDGTWGRVLAVDDRTSEAPTYTFTSRTNVAELNPYPDGGSRPFRGPLAGDAPVRSTWTFVAASYDSSNHTSTIYTGDNVATVVDANPFTGWDWNTFQIGATASTFDNINGAIDNFFVFNDVLTKAQIDTIRTAANPLAAAQSVSSDSRKWKIDFQATDGNDTLGIDNTPGNGVDEWNMLEPGAHNTNVQTPVFTSLKTTAGTTTGVDFSFVNTPTVQMEEGFDQLVAATFPTRLSGWNWYSKPGATVGGDGIVINNTAFQSNNADYEISGLEAGRSYKIAVTMPMVFPYGGPQNGQHINAFDTDGDGTIDNTMRMDTWETGANNEFVVKASDSGVVHGRLFPRSPYGSAWNYWAGIGGMTIEELDASTSVTPTEFFTGGVREDGEAPVHAYNFNGSGSADQTPFSDRIGTAHGELRTSDSSSSLSGGKMILSGTSATSGFGDLPNGIISGAAAGGDAGDMTLQLWVAGTNVAGVSDYYPRLYSFGDTTAGEVTDLTTGHTSNDRFELLFNKNKLRGDDAGRNPAHEYWLQDASAGSSDVANQVFDDAWQEDVMLQLTVTIRHNQDGDPVMSVYHNGSLEREMVMDDELSDLNDVNVWLGRAQDTSARGVAADYDEARIFDFAMTQEQVIKSVEYGADWSGIKGDVDATWEVIADDIDSLYAAITAGSTERRYDVAENGGAASMADMDELVEVVLDTKYGDAQLDGDVDIDDGFKLVANWQATGQGWEDGDFTGDGNVNIDDGFKLVENWGWSRGAGGGGLESGDGGLVSEDAGVAGPGEAEGAVVGGSIILDLNGVASFKVYVGVTTGETEPTIEPAEIFDTDIDVLSFDAGKTAPNFFGVGLPQNTVEGSPEENFGELLLFGTVSDPSRDMWVNMSALPVGVSLWLKYAAPASAAEFFEIARGVPEPGTVALLASALLGLALVYRRKRES